MTGASLRWGLLGAARITQQALVPAIRASGGTVQALGCRSYSRGRDMAAELDIATAVEGYRALLELDLDCVYIALPNSLHKEWTLAALEHGLHVLCEKPLALTAAEALEMGAAAQEAGRVLAEAVMYRYHPRWQVVLQLIGDGEIGALRQISGAFAFPLRPPPDIRWEASLGGGALYDVGSYLINAARWATGREPNTALATAVWRHGVDESAVVALRFSGDCDGDACLAALTCGFAAAESQWMRFEGTRGAIYVDRPFTAWRGEALPVMLSHEGGEALGIPCPATDPYLAMVRAFEAAVRRGEPVLTSAADGSANLAVVEACRRSLGAGRSQGVVTPADESGN